jgi:hypothetical protein
MQMPVTSRDAREDPNAPCAPALQTLLAEPGLPAAAGTCSQQVAPGVQGGRGNSVEVEAPAVGPVQGVGEHGALSWRPAQILFLILGPAGPGGDHGAYAAVGCVTWPSLQAKRGQRGWHHDAPPTVASCRPLVLKGKFHGGHLKLHAEREDAECLLGVGMLLNLRYALKHYPVYLELPGGA